MQKRILIAAALLLLPAFEHHESSAQAKPASNRHEWRTATESELEAALPARAPVVNERIETETRSATGIVDAHGHMIAAIVLITAGYAANGKYSHYLLAQSALRIGPDILLKPGAYVIGWTREQDGLLVHIYEAASGAERGSITAHLIATPVTVVPVKIWPPSDRSIIQIGRFMLPYTLVE